MRTGLIRNYINTLRLRAQAPFPSQIRMAREAILAWRRAQRLHLVPR